MANRLADNGLFIIERILRDRAGIWKQIIEERELRPLTQQMLVSSVFSLAMYGLVLGASNSVAQAFTSLIKLPLLFLATLAICLPTLYLFNLVFGARLSMMQAVALIMVTITVTSVLTLAFAPISLFFLISAQSYSFFKLLNVTILTLTAAVGLRFMVTGMRALNDAQELANAGLEPVPAPVPAAAVLAPVAVAPVAAAPVAATGALVTAGQQATVPVPVPAGVVPNGGGGVAGQPVPAVGGAQPPSPKHAGLDNPAPEQPAARPEAQPAQATQADPVGPVTPVQQAGWVAPAAPVQPPAAAQAPVQPAIPVPAVALPQTLPAYAIAPYPVPGHPAPVPVPSRIPPARPAPVEPAARPASMGLLYVWILLFGFVGTQLAWTLRPFFGSPGEPFALFRHINGTFYADVLHTIARLFS